MGGGRVYRESDVALLRFTRRARELGFALGHVREIVDRHRRGATTTQATIRLLERLLKTIERDARQLETRRQAVKAALRAAAGQDGRGGSARLCEIVESHDGTGSI